MAPITASTTAIALPRCGWSDKHESPGVKELEDSKAPRLKDSQTHRGRATHGNTAGTYPTGPRLTYKGGPYEAMSASMVQSAHGDSTLDQSGLGRAAQVWRHAAHCLAWGSGVFQRQPGARARRPGGLVGAQYVQFPADAHATPRAQNRARFGQIVGGTG